MMGREFALVVFLTDFTSFLMMMRFATPFAQILPYRWYNSRCRCWGDGFTIVRRIGVEGYRYHLRQAFLAHPTHRAFGRCTVFPHYATGRNVCSESIIGRPSVTFRHEHVHTVAVVGYRRGVGSASAIVTDCCYLLGLHAYPSVSQLKQVGHVPLRLDHCRFTAVHRFVFFSTLGCLFHRSEQVAAAAHGHHWRNSSCN